MQETSDRRTYGWNILSEQRKSNWQHPNTDYRKRKATPRNDECDTSQYPHPDRTLPTKAVQITANQGGDVVLEAVHFLVEIGIPRHPLYNQHKFDSFLRRCKLQGVPRTGYQAAAAAMIDLLRSLR
jgi:hypothetical protein